MKSNAKSQQVNQAGELSQKLKVIPQYVGGEGEQHGEGVGDVNIGEISCPKKISLDPECDLFPPTS